MIVSFLIDWVWPQSQWRGSEQLNGLLVNFLFLRCPNGIIAAALCFLSVLMCVRDMVPVWEEAHVRALVCCFELVPCAVGLRVAQNEDRSHGVTVMCSVASTDFCRMWYRICSGSRQRMWTSHMLKHLFALHTSPPLSTCVSGITNLSPLRHNPPITLFHHPSSLPIHERVRLLHCDWLLMNSWRHYQSAPTLWQQISQSRI